MNDNIDVSPQNEKPRRINKYVLLAGVAIVAFVVMYLLFSSPGKKSTSIEQVKPNNAATTQNTLGNDERLKRLNEDAEKTKEKETRKNEKTTAFSPDKRTTPYSHIQRVVTSFRSLEL